MTDYRNMLYSELDNVRRARDQLLYSYNKCRTIGVNAELSEEELESFEALTSRFARLSDILTQKVFRLIDTIDLEEPGTVRDRINRAEKKGLLQDAAVFVDIRILRNEIAHEYKTETILNIFERILTLTPDLLAAVENTLGYAEKIMES